MTSRNLLDRIDSVLDNLCPCGAEPREGSAYCSEDCVPTYRAAHTSSDTDGTQMRWRPDLVTEVDDSGLILVDQHQRGRFNAQVFEYASDDRLHFRLDDGHRFVGTDIDGLNGEADYRDDAWRRLERELTDDRRLSPNPDPWADVMDPFRSNDRVYLQILRLFTSPPPPSIARISWATAGASPEAPASLTDIGHLTEDRITELPSLDWGDTPIHRVRVLAQRTVTVHLNNSAGTFAETVRRSLEGIAAAAASVAEGYRAAFQRFERITREPDMPEHPMLRAIEQRRNRNTGPAVQRQTPRRIEPRRVR